MRGKLFHGMSLMAFAQLVAQAIPFVAGIWIADQLSEKDFGAYRLLLVLMGYMAYTTLGIELRVMYKLPEAIGGNRLAELERMPVVLHSFLVLNRFAIASFFLLFALFDVSLNGKGIAISWMLAGLIIALDGWNNLYEIVLRSYQRYMTLGAIRILAPLMYLLFLFVFFKTWGLGINGILTAFIVSGLFKLYLGWKYSEQKLRFWWSLETIVDYIKFGLPLKINSFIWTAITTLNLWFASLYLPPSETGILGFAMMATTAYTMLSGVMTEISSVRFMTFLGKTVGSDQSANRKHFIYQASVGWAAMNLLLMLLALGVIFLALQFFVPKYHDAWNVLCILLVGYYAYGIVDTIGNLLIVNGRSLQLTKLFFTVLAIQVVLVFVLCSIRPNLALISAVQSFSLVLLAALLAWKYFCGSDEGGESKHLFLRLALIVGYGISVMLLFGFAVSYHFGVAGLLMSLSVALVLCSPLMFAGYRNIKVFWHGISA